MGASHRNVGRLERPSRRAELLTINTRSRAGSLRHTPSSARLPTHLARLAVMACSIDAFHGCVGGHGLSVGWAGLGRRREHSTGPIRSRPRSLTPRSANFVLLASPGRPALSARARDASAGSTRALVGPAGKRANSRILPQSLDPRCRSTRCGGRPHHIRIPTRRPGCSGLWPQSTHCVRRYVLSSPRLIHF